MNGSAKGVYPGFVYSDYDLRNVKDIGMTEEEIYAAIRIFSNREEAKHEGRNQRRHDRGHTAGDC
ncbi:hypothetical protein BN871_AH_00170 [Paenibacillus sp. P22]|nr:hypothetical protein BN871_AH_00170 [Paenibacillus sp. P22]